MIEEWGFVYRYIYVVCRGLDVIGRKIILYLHNNHEPIIKSPTTVLTTIFQIFKLQKEEYFI